MKKFLSISSFILLIISVGTIVNYFCLPLYVHWGMMYPIVLTEPILNKWMLCLLIFEVPWMFAILGVFVFCVILIIGINIWLSTSK